jgi:hypothetical protein
MKIIKAHKNIRGYLYLLVDEIPKITYKKIGMSYVGSDDQEFFNDYLKYEQASKGFQAFAGREFTIELKDGTIVKLKDHWWDSGAYDKENEYIQVRLGTLKQLQDCYVFFGYNIRKDKLEKMLSEYLSENKFYDYREMEKWCKMQYNWYPLIFHGKELSFMMNYKGNIIESNTHEPKYALHNYVKCKKGKQFELKLFKLSYYENGRLVKLEDSYMNVTRETLPEFEFEKYMEHTKKK